MISYFKFGGLPFLQSKSHQFDPNFEGFNPQSLPVKSQSVDGHKLSTMGFYGLTPLISIVKSDTGWLNPICFFCFLGK